MSPENVIIDPDHFRKNLTDDEARALFKKCVGYVEIETFSFCNRRCFFCPNKDMPFRQDQKNNRLMDEALYLRILADLASVDYSGDVQFGRYNEPLSQRELMLKRIRQAREFLPRAYLYTHSNGDYITPDFLDALADAGLNQIAAQTYLGNEERWNDEKMLGKQEQQMQKWGVSHKGWIIDVPGVRYYRHLSHPRIPAMTLDARNFDEIGTDRGGLVRLKHQAQRTSPCFVSFDHVYVDYNGSVLPCCNLRSDVAAHKPYVVGVLGDELSIFRAFVNLAEWRKSLLVFGPKKAPCDTCSYDQISYSEEIDAHLNAIAGQYAKP